MEEGFSKLYLFFVEQPKPKGPPSPTVGASPAPTNTVTIGAIIGAYKSLVANRCLNIYKSKNKYMGKL